MYNLKTNKLSVLKNKEKLIFLIFFFNFNILIFHFPQFI